MPIAHDSFFGYLNLYKRQGNHFTRPMWYRPPFPILVEEPTVGTTLYNMNRADFGFFATLTFFGSMFHYTSIKWDQTSYYFQGRMFKVYMGYTCIFAAI